MSRGNVFRGAISGIGRGTLHAGRRMIKALKPNKRGSSGELEQFLDPTPQWIAKENTKIEGKILKITSESQKVYKKTDLEVIDGEEKNNLLKLLGPGATLNASNAEFVRVNIDGVLKTFLVKKLDGIDSVTASDFLRMISAKRFFAKQEILIQDNIRDKDGVDKPIYYMAVKFEFDLTRREGDTEEAHGEKSYYFLGDPTREDDFSETFRYIRPRFVQDKQFMMDAAYMFGANMVISGGAYDDNPNNYVTTKENRVGKIDSQSSNTHPDHFALPLYGQTEEFKIKLIEYIKTKERGSEITKHLLTFRALDLLESIRIKIQNIETITSGSSTKDMKDIEECLDSLRDLKAKIKEPRPVEGAPKSSLLESIKSEFAFLEQELQPFKDALTTSGVTKETLDKDLKKLNEELETKKPHKDFTEEKALEFFTRDPTVTDHYESGLKPLDRFKVTGCFQSAGFFLTHIAKLTNIDESRLAQRVADKLTEKGIRKGIPDGKLPQYNEATNQFIFAAEDLAKMRTKDELQQIANCYNEALFETSFDVGKSGLGSNNDSLEIRKKNILKKIETIISDEARQEPPEYRTRDLFICFMHGMQKAIDLTNNNDFETSYITQYSEHHDMQNAAHEAIKFLKENAATMQELYGPFLELYKNKYLNQLTEYEPRAKINAKPQIPAISDKDIISFNKGETVILPQILIDTANQFHLKDRLPNPNKPEGKKFFYHDNNDKKAPRSYKTEEEKGKTILPLLKYVSKVDDIAITKAKNLTEADYVLDSEKIKLPEFNNSNFTNIGLFCKAEQTPEELAKKTDIKININFGNRLNYGGESLNSFGGNNEEKTRHSTANYALAYLHQRKENRNRDTFYDLSLGDYNLYNQKGDLRAGRPILIEGQYFSDNKGQEFQARELDMALPQLTDIKDLKNPTDIAKHIFLTSYQGFKLCKDKYQDSHKNITIKTTIDDASHINPFTQLSMQIMAAQMAGVELKITDKFFEKDNKKDEISYFKTRVLPYINAILSKESSIESKINEIHHKCQEFEMIFNRIKNDISAETYNEVLTSAYQASRESGATYNKAIKNVAPVIGRINEVFVPEGNDRTTQHSGADIKRAKQAVANEIGGIAKHRRVNPFLHPFAARTHIEKHKKIEEELLETLKEKGFISPEIKNPKELAQAIKKEATEIEQNKTELKLVDKKLQDNQAEIDIELRKPNSATKVKTISPLLSYSITNKLQDEVNKVIAIVVNSKGPDEQADKKINALLDSLAQYAKEYLTGVDGKDVDSILKGGKDAGFTKWKEELEFKKILERNCRLHGLTLDFKNPDTIEDFAYLSADLQDASRDIFSTTKGRYYQNELGNHITNMTRSWRMALVRNMEVESRNHEATRGG